MNKLAVFDIDGVLCDFEPAIVHALARQFGAIAKLNRHEYYFEKRFSNYPEVAKRALELTADPNFYYGLPVDNFARDFARDLHEEGYSIMYVTSRPKSCKEFTRRWLEKNVFNDRGDLGLFCGVQDKSEFLGDMDVDIVVDDSREQVEELLNSGKSAFCWSQEWNEGVFPRLYVDKDEALMLWRSEDEEAEPFWASIEVEN